MRVNLNLNNPDAMIYTAYAQLMKDQRGQALTHTSLLKNYLNRVRQFRSQKMQQLQKLLKTKSLKDRLAEKVKEFRAQKNITWNEKWLGNFKGQRRNNLDHQMREAERWLKFVREADASLDNLTDQNKQDPPVLPAKNDALAGEAFVQTLKQLYGLQADQSQSQNMLYDQMGRSVSEQKQSAEEALKALKKSKIFGFVFQVIERFMQVLVSVLTMGAGSPLVMGLAKASSFLKILVPSLVQMGNDLFLQVLSGLVLKPIHRKLEQESQEMKNASKVFSEKLKVAHGDRQRANGAIQSDKRVLEQLEMVNRR